MEADSVRCSYISVLKKALKMLEVFEISMKQDNRKVSGLRIGNATKTPFRTGLSIFQGASGIDDGRPNFSRSLDVTPLLMMSLRTLTGLSNRSFAVLMIVMSVATFFWPCLVIFPKVIFLKSTAFRMLCSAKLLAGEMAGFFRKTKSSFLWVHLIIGKVHGRLKFVNFFAEIFPAGKNPLGGFSIEKYAKLLEGAKRMSRIIDPVLRKIKTPNPHLRNLSICAGTWKKLHVLESCEERIRKSELPCAFIGVGILLYNKRNLLSI